MLEPEWMFNELTRHGTEFFSGVPDSVLQHFCSYAAAHAPIGGHVIAANEGGAVALAVGRYLATGHPALVYMQNSGLGNAINPLLSLADVSVYSIPMLLLIGWRGKPGAQDEPQHLKQGRVTHELLDAMGIPWCGLSGSVDAASREIENAFSVMRASNTPYALLVEQGVFSAPLPPREKKHSADEGISRETAIAVIFEACDESTLFIGTTGMTSRELFEVDAKKNGMGKRLFLNVGAMGHCSQIAASIAAARPNLRVVCLDGDGSVLMHAGALAVISEMKPMNLLHVVCNNGVHESVGGQPTANPGLDLARLASTVGYHDARRVSSGAGIRAAIADWTGKNGPFFLEMMVCPGHRLNIGRPGSELLHRKRVFMDYIARAYRSPS